MDVNAILDSLISSANTDQTALNDLIAFLQGQTLVSGNPNQSPPQVDANGVWTLQQLTANSGVDFEGVYQLPVPDACGKLEIVSIDTHQNPASAAPARLKGCVSESEPNPVFTDQPSVSALDGQCMNAFSIRSSVPFDVQIRVVECEAGPCTAERIRYFNYDTDQWENPEALAANRVRFQSTFNPSNSRQMIWFFFDSETEVSCCNVIAWENYSGPQLFIVNHCDCNGNLGNSIVPQTGNWWGQQINGNQNDSPYSIEMVFGAP